MQRVKNISAQTRALLEVLEIEPFDGKLCPEFMDHSDPAEEKPVFFLPKDLPEDYPMRDVAICIINQAIKEMQQAEFEEQRTKVIQITAQEFANRCVYMSGENAPYWKVVYIEFEKALDVHYLPGVRFTTRMLLQYIEEHCNDLPMGWDRICAYLDLE